MQLFTLAIPIFFDMLFRFLSLLINTYMVSLVDVNLIPSMGAGNQIYAFFITIFSFLSVGCSIVVAQAIGAKKKKFEIKALHLSLFLNLLVGILSYLFIFLNSNLILNLMKIPEISLKLSQDYLLILSFGMIFDSISIIMSAIVRVKNRAIYATMVVFAFYCISIFGNYMALFVYPNLGLVGVAYSFLVGRIIGFVLIFLILIKVAKVRLYFRMFFDFNLEILRKILKVGVPSAGENLLWMLQYMVAFSFVASMGQVSLGVQTIYFQLSALIFLSGSAISIANEIIIGKFVGAKKFDEAYKHSFIALFIGICITFCVVLSFYFSQNFIMDLLNLTDEFKEVMRPLFGVSLVLELGRTLNIVMVNALRASGDAKFPMMSGICFMWGLSLPLGYFLGIYLGFGIVGIWLGFCADEWVRGVVNTLRWKSKKWQTKALV